MSRGAVARVTAFFGGTVVSVRTGAASRRLWKPFRNIHGICWTYWPSASAWIRIHKRKTPAKRGLVCTVVVATMPSYGGGW